MSNNTKCTVNSDGSVCLRDILNSFNFSIREEHAWALCYQCAKYFKDCLSAAKTNTRMATEVEHVYLQTDGNVHENTVNSNDKARKPLRNEADIISSLGMIIYCSLDQKIPDGEEKILSQDLEQLIEDMLSHHFNSSSTMHETDDEGIEGDSEEAEEEPSTSKTAKSITLQEVLHRCEGHLGSLTRSEAEAHYKAVVRAIVAEALELSTFLEKVAEGNINLPNRGTSNQDLDQLNFSDWARFWVQVMGELRMGVKLKKVNYSKAPIEYELTPYEVLMKEIRTCRYNLRKVMINGDIPSRVTKDAHAIILEFIRSRPPLRKASDRQLPPRRRQLTPREQLLNSIKKGRKLKPTPKPRTSISKENHTREKSHDEDEHEQTTSQATSSGRRLIKIDFSQFEEDDDDDDEEDQSYSPDLLEPGLWSSEYHPQLSDTTLEAYDLATQSLNSRINLRRHTLGVVDPNIGCYSVPQSRPCSRQSCNSSEAESMQLEPEVAQSIQDQLISSQTWQDSISLDDRLSLTLQEIVHIRAVLTKAELESLPMEGRVRQDVEARKVCFLCLKTRFGIFGPWGQRCSLCKRTVCSRCYSRMNIPMEHFSSVPVVLLSPSIMCTPDDEHKETFAKSLVNKIMDPNHLSPGSGTHSPQTSPDAGHSSMESSIISDPGGISSTSSSSNKFRSKAHSVIRSSRVSDRLKASQMVVCHDCKMMVLQIIKSARANRSAIRNKTLQSLTLNLSPIF